MKLSISGKDKYNTCSEMYNLHYNKKIRPLAESSALVFGGALDLALNKLLETRDYVSGVEVFTEEWAKQKTNYNVTFFKNDLNVELLTQEECDLLDKVKDENERNHLAHWTSLSKKGILMLEAYYKEILPRIKNVVVVQKELYLHGVDAEGKETEDSVGGILDFIADVYLEDDTIVRAVVDNKSTSKPYPKNSVLTKEQTALYSYIEDLEYAAFATINKLNFKTQLIVDKVPKELQETTVQSFVNTVELIKSGKFEKKEVRTRCFNFGRKCEYYDYCWNNGSMKGLYKKDEK